MIQNSHKHLHTHTIHIHSPVKNLYNNRLEGAIIVTDFSNSNSNFNKTTIQINHNDILKTGFMSHALQL